tara:strand:+ start:108 stop:338 length:231 start_codon:yes stop_codon:yes gene_type:complete
MEIPIEKQEEHRKVSEAIEAFLRNGGKIQKLPPILSFGHLSLHEMENEGQTEYEKIIQETTKTKKGHPWRTFRSVV